MHICYDPDTLQIRHIITLGFADCHLADGSAWLKTDKPVPVGGIKLERGDDGEVRVAGHAEVRTMRVRKADDDFPKPPRTLKGARAAALEKIASRRAERVSGTPEASAYYQRKETWAKAHLAGEVAHPVINAEAVEKSIACRELCARSVGRADAARASRAAIIDQAGGAFDRAEHVIKACQSIEEIDDYMAHFG